MVEKVTILSPARYLFTLMEGEGFMQVQNVVINGKFAFMGLYDTILDEAVIRYLTVVRFFESSLHVDWHQNRA